MSIALEDKPHNNKCPLTYFALALSLLSRYHTLWNPFGQSCPAVLIMSPRKTLPTPNLLVTSLSWRDSTDAMKCCSVVAKMLVCYQQHPSSFQCKAHPVRTAPRKINSLSARPSMCSVFSPGERMDN